MDSFLLSKFRTTSLHTHACYKPFSFHAPRFDHSNTIWGEVRIVKLLVMPLLKSLASSLILVPNILISTRFTNMLALHSFLNVTDHTKLQAQLLSRRNPKINLFNLNHIPDGNDMLSRCPFEALCNFII